MKTANKPIVAEELIIDCLKEAWKDCIDVCRYAAIAGIDHVDETRNLATRQGAGGY
jgi:hypothetical protein